MLPTNKHLHSKLECLETRLRQLDERPGLDSTTAAAAEHMREEREVLQVVLLNRRVEAARPVVDFRRWLSGNGAASLLGAKDLGLKRALAS